MLPGLGGSAPAARRGSAASGWPLHRGCECQRGHMGQLGTLHNVKAVSQHWPLLWWQVWPRDMLHMVTRQDTWVTKTKPHLTPAHHSWDDAWLIHPTPVACAYQLVCRLRLPSNTMISFPNDHHQYTTNILCNIMLMLRQRKRKLGGDKHIKILCIILCILCSLLNLINCMTGEHDWQSLDRGKLRREKPLTVQHIITNSGVVHCIVCECVTSLSRHCPRPDRVVHSEDGWDRPPAPESSLLSCVAVAAEIQTTYFSADISQ